MIPEAVDQLMHDWILVGIDLDWVEGSACLRFRAASVDRAIIAIGLTEFFAPRRQEWGPSAHVMNSKRSGRGERDERLEIQMQSGDVIVIAAAKIQMPEPVDQRLFLDRLPLGRE
jgi:hypothetical protein